ncbi:hypothetical protein AB0J38_17540 [Streptomyces sp. NPDC050095]|uniref:hypothetical protein n=1 Tax=unclassified Streptomyces TaxID=2593676 RepID=UPI0034190647
MPNPEVASPADRSSHQLLFSDLTDYPVMSQALDNQWMPPRLAIGRQRAGATGGSTPQMVEAGAAELRRCLVNSGTLVINRAHLINTPALYVNYLPTADPGDRAAFAQLLNNRAIVPYLYNERDPGEDYAWTYDEPVHRAWRRLLAHEAEPDCVRFSWSDEENAEQNGMVGRYFSRQISALRRIPTPLIAEHLQLAPASAQVLRQGILRDIYFWAGEQDPDADITRSQVYERFFTRPGTKPHELLLREGEHIVPAKQLVDLLYNIGVAAKAGTLVPLTPPDSPPRSVLDELNQAATAQRDPEAVGLLLRQLFADDLHRVVDGPNSYGSLSLSDVLALRREEEWRSYIDALDAMVFGRFGADRVPQAGELSDAAADIARLHAQMLGKARMISRGHQGFRREIGVTLLLESPGLVLQMVSGQSTLLYGSVQAASVAAGPLVMRLLFKERGVRSADRFGGLGHSITFPTVRLGNLRKDWAEILSTYGGRITETGAEPLAGLADFQAQSSS